MSRIDYKSAGVNIDAGNEVVARIKDKVHATYPSYVISQIGGFAAMVDLSLLTTGCKQPILVQSIDGLGTKPIIARMMNRFDTLGIDLLSATANDILVCGATPVTLLDYIANDRLDANKIDSFISGLAAACAQNNVALVGGETAEMPDTYLAAEQDIVGVITGIVDKENIIDGSHISPGDVVLGFASNGFHTNGYSLARKVFFSKGYSVDSFIPDFDATLGEILLSPHLNYSKAVHTLLHADITIKGMAHITGGGLLENIPRVLPNHCQVRLQQKSWPLLPEFVMLQQLAQLEQYEMYRTCNMGIGYVAIVSADCVDQMHALIKPLANYELYTIGEVVAGETGVIIE